MSGEIQIKKRTVRNAVIVALAILVLFLAYYYIASYWDAQIYPRYKIINDLQEQISVAQNDLNGNVTLVNDLTSQLADLKITTSQLEPENEELTSQVKDLEDEIASLNSQIGRLQSQIDGLNHLIDAIQNATPDSGIS